MATVRTRILGQLADFFAEKKYHGLISAIASLHDRVADNDDRLLNAFVHCAVSRGDWSVMDRVQDALRWLQHRHRVFSGAEFDKLLKDLRKEELIAKLLNYEKENSQDAEDLVETLININNFDDENDRVLLRKLAFKPSHHRRFAEKHKDDWRSLQARLYSYVDAVDRIVGPSHLTAVETYYARARALDVPSSDNTHVSPEKKQRSDTSREVSSNRPTTLTVQDCYVQGW